jgi:long-chain acyl-CoA synthetase
VLGVLPLFHALAQLANLLLPLAVGARVVFLETLSSQELVRALADRRITIFVCVPQFFYLIHQRVIAEVDKRGWLMRRMFRGLMAVGFCARRIGVNLGPLLFARVHATLGRQMRLLITGGSKFDPVVGRELYAMGLTILQAYGLTETSGAATLTTAHDAHIDTVGRAVPGSEIRILPAESDDVDGEIAIRGPIVMQGYFGRPDATAAVMRDGWLLTGDLGRLDARSRLSITGRKKEVIVLASGKNIYPEEVEAHYRKSAYVKEICVVGARSADRPTSERLHAVIVPDAGLLRERKMTNAGEILRFEIEGLSASLPHYKRVLGYDIWFEPLPRTTTGKLKRHEIERLLAAKGSGALVRAEPASDEAASWLADAHVASALEVIRGRVPDGAAVRAGANLELDLGLDSMERVELVTELEQRFATKVPADRAHEIFNVRQLIEAVRPGNAPVHPVEPGLDSRESWGILLRDLPPDTDPVLSGLLERKPVLTPLLFLASRVAGFLLARIRASGLEHLPRDGTFLICPNHQSYIDPFLVCRVLPYSVLKRLFFVGAVEYFETPAMRRIARAVNCVPVDPDSNLVPAMKAGAFGLAHGKVLMLFPEGERAIDGTVRKFKKGAPILARHLRVPIVPVALKGAFEIWPRGRSLDWTRRLPWSGHRVRIEFLPPMTFGESETYAEAASRLRDAVDARWRVL